MNAEELKSRTKSLGLRVIKLVSALPSDTASRAIGSQLVRSGTSVGANYRAACRARSKKDFVAKLAIVEEEADETCYWLEMIVDAKLLTAKRVKALLDEANEITAIISQSRKTARTR